MIHMKENAVGKGVQAPVQLTVRSFPIPFIAHGDASLDECRRCYLHALRVLDRYIAGVASQVSRCGIPTDVAKKIQSHLLMLDQLGEAYHESVRLKIDQAATAPIVINTLHRHPQHNRPVPDPPPPRPSPPPPPPKTE